MKTASLTGKSILIMGVARSGTTAIYGLLQHILEKCFPGETDFVYEPFLWDRKPFNKPYTELTDEFRYAASVSVEGMYHHKRMPMLVDKKSAIDQNSTEWLSRTLTPGDGKRHYLGKMIRANGRIRLIREISPDTRIVFVIRNPVDVLNSAAQLFSLYGSEFYQSDFDRFAKEVASQFGHSICAGTNEISAIEADYAYWYFSNLAFLNYFQSFPEKILTVAYEAFVEDRASVVGKICEFVGIDFNPDYISVATQSVGRVQHNMNGLTLAQLKHLQSKVNAYKDLLERVSVVPLGSIDKFIRTRQWSKIPRAEITSQYFNALGAVNQLRSKDEHIQALEAEYLRVTQDVSRIQSSNRYRFANWIFAPFDRLTKRRMTSKGD